MKLVSFALCFLGLPQFQNSLQCSSHTTTLVAGFTCLIAINWWLLVLAFCNPVPLLLNQSRQTCRFFNQSGEKQNRTWNDVTQLFCARHWWRVLLSFLIGSLHYFHARIVIGQTWMRLLFFITLI